MCPYTHENIILRDRSHAGQLLSKALENYANNPEAILLALPRGGVPVAFEIASTLHLPLDIALVRKLGAPHNPEYAIGALAFDGSYIWNTEALENLAISQDQINKIISQEQQELERRRKYYRPNHPMPSLKNHIVILVDDGLATGTTMRAAIYAVQKSKPKKIVVAVPVAALSTYKEFTQEVDELVCLQTPPYFSSVGRWYQDFKQVEDEEVCRLLNQSIKPQQN